MAKMKNIISPQNIITRVVSHGNPGSNVGNGNSQQHAFLSTTNSGTNNNSIRLGELKDVLINMLDLTNYELLLNETVRNVFREDLCNVQGVRLSKMVRIDYFYNDFHFQVLIILISNCSSALLCIVHLWKIKPQFRLPMKLQLHLIVVMTSHLVMLICNNSWLPEALEGCLRRLETSKLKILKLM